MIPSNSKFINIGEIHIAFNEVISTVLGSCVSVCLYDRFTKIGGMNHYLLAKNPHKENSVSNTYGEYSIPKLISLMEENGANIDSLEAKIFGGAAINFSKVNIGQKNINLAETILKEYNIPIISKDISGNNGRKIYFDISKNIVFVKYY